MGRAGRIVPKRLGEKLKAIRENLGVETYEEMITRLDYQETQIYRSAIYEYEKGTRVPFLPILLRYARLANVSTDVLIDDELDLPANSPPEIK